MKKHLQTCCAGAAAGVLGAAFCGAPASAQHVTLPVVVVDSTALSRHHGHTVDTLRWMGPAFHTGAVATQISAISLGMQHPKAIANPLESWWPRSERDRWPSAVAVAASSPVVTTTADFKRCMSARPPPGAASWAWGTQTIAAVLRLYQLDDSTELPQGAALASTTIDVAVFAPNDGRLNTYTAVQLGSVARTTLQAFKKYALVLASKDGCPLELYDNRGPANAYRFAGGFSGAATGYLRTLDGGTHWSKDGTVTPVVRMTVTAIADQGTDRDMGSDNDSDWPEGALRMPELPAWAQWPWVER
ncbi:MULTISPECIES: hypothetical protein [unclassified Comamonas]|uniref:hypothetical protein n=1 Tax=unclassified Comamonas TaxID=2638500 RepID=UPI0011DD0AFC|nr:hypothetical protein [Comamonas sp. B-9]